MWMDVEQKTQEQKKAEMEMFRNGGAPTVWRLMHRSVDVRGIT